MIEHRDPDLASSHLPIKVSGHEALVKEFDAVHFLSLRGCGGNSRSVLPQGATEIFARSRGFVSSDGVHRLWLPKLCILARRDDGGDLLIRWDLLQLARQRRGNTGIACGDAKRAYLQYFLVHVEMKLAPQAFLWPAMRTGVPLSLTLGVDPGRVDQRLQSSCPTAIGDGEVQGFLRRHRGLMSGTFQSSPTSRNKLSTNPVVCRRGMPNSTFTVK